MTLRTLVFLFAVPCLCVAGAMLLLLSDNPQAHSFSLLLTTLSAAFFGLVLRAVWEGASGKAIVARFPGPVELILPIWARLLGFFVYGGLGAAFVYHLPLQRGYELGLVLTLIMAAALIVFGLFQLSSHSLTLTSDHLEVVINGRRRSLLQWERTRKFRWVGRYNIPMFDYFDGTAWSPRKLPRKYGFDAELPTILNGWRERAVQAKPTPKPRSGMSERRRGSLLDYT